MSYLPRKEKIEVLRTLFFRDGPLCCWCDKKLLVPDLLPLVKSGKLPDDYPTIEHMVKRAHGGRNKPHNYRLSCSTCNSTRDKREKEIKQIEPSEKRKGKGTYTH